MESILHWVTQYGYAAIFGLLVLGIVGLPIPDETMLIFAGYLIYRGRLQAVPTFVAALAGSACGMSLSYALGRTIGPYLLRRFGRYVHVTEERLARVRGWFHRAGHWTLTFGYYVPGVRHLTAYVAGASNLELPHFALFAYSGGALWCTSFLALGYFLGEKWSRTGERVQWNLAGGAAAIILLFLAAQFFWRRRKAR